MIRTIAAFLLVAVSSVALAQAPANPPVRIRGTVEKIDGNMLTVKARNGQSMTVKLDGKEVNGFKIKIDGDKVMIGTATVTKADIKAKNGVVHVIDTVLVPTAK